MAAREEAARPQLGIQLDERARVGHLVAKAVVLFLRTIAPIDLVGLAQRGHVFDPAQQVLVPSRCFRGNGLYGHIVGPEKSGVSLAARLGIAIALVVSRCFAAYVFIGMRSS